MSRFQVKEFERNGRTFVRILDTSRGKGDGAIVWQNIVSDPRALPKVRELALRKLDEFRYKPRPKSDGPRGLQELLRF